jgi:GNAT superfamily N-acetyltransferase
MSEKISFVPASSMTFEAFAQLYTRSFENYFYPMAQTVEGFAARARTEQHDLYRSVVLRVDGAPAGQATLALRGDQAWCGGFGIVPEFRGRRLGPPLFAELVAQARQAGARTLQLEALTRNAPALRVYTGAGLRPLRETRLLEWKREGDADAAPTGTPAFAQPADMMQLAACFSRLHAVKPVWGRDLPSLMLRKGLLQTQIMRGEDIAACVLFAGQEGTSRIADVGAEDAAQAAALLAQMQSHYQHIVFIDAPAESPITAAFDGAGFHEFDRQYELFMTL